MAWTILERIIGLGDVPQGFCGNPYVDNPLASYTRNAYATNPNRAEFVNAMLIDDYAFNWHDVTVGQTLTISLKDGYWIKVERQVSNYYQVTSNLPGVNAAGVSTVFNFLYFAAWLDPAQEKAAMGYYGWYSPIDYSPGYVPLSSSASSELYQILTSMLPPEPPTDPYAPGGTSEPSEPNGTFEPTEDDVDIPSTPTYNLGISHLLTAYVCDLNEINTFADYMWDNAASLAGIDKVIFGNVADCVLSVHMLPFEVSHEETASTVTVGNYPTTVQLKRATVQFVDVDCGSISLAPFWASYLDFNPLCKMTLMLPYVGEVSIDPDEVYQEIGGEAKATALNVLYRVDILTGALVCFVRVTRKKSDGSTTYPIVIGQYAGTCSLSIPISQSDFTQVKNAVFNAAMATLSLATAAASGGLTAPEAVGAAGAAVCTTANNIGNGKLRISHSGGLAGSSGFMGIQKPYLIIKRAKQSLPENFGDFRGYPLNVTKVLGECTGFTAVSEITLDAIPLTREELSELREILRGGIFI